MQPNAKKETPHFHGHRDRLRQKFLENGPDSFADYELLELVLFLAIPMKDVKPLAKNLIARFGGLPEIMNAPVEELVKVEGIKQNTATALILVHNHPSGDPKPSQADVEMTKHILRAAEPFSITIHDHVIISKNGYTSFKTQGLI